MPTTNENLATAFAGESQANRKYLAFAKQAEKEGFGQIAEARSRLLNAAGAQGQGEGGDKTPEQRQEVINAANSFGGTLGRLMARKPSP